MAARKLPRPGVPIHGRVALASAAGTGRGNGAVIGGLRQSEESLKGLENRLRNPLEKSDISR